MTGAEFSGVDIDLLADYVGGALDGTPDEAVVTALIAEDAAWREAHVLLSGGVATVTEQLRALGSAVEPMPAEVFARLDAALLAETTAVSDGSPAGSGAHGTDTGASGAPAEMEPGSDGAAPARYLVAVPSGSRSNGSRSERVRRLRWAAPVGIAAGVLAFVGFGVQQLVGSGSSSQDKSTASSAAGEAAQNADESTLTLADGTVQVSNSDNDYRRDTLAESGVSTFAGQVPRALESRSSKKATGDADAARAIAGDPALDRLRVQQALQACIDAIAAKHGAGPIAAQTVDFARYEGRPAVIVRFIAAGATWVWASGPECGASGVGADKLAAVQVG